VRRKHGPTKGYGNSLMGGIAAARSQFIIRERRVELILVYMPLEDYLYVREDGLETFYDRIFAGQDSRLG